VLFKTVFPAPLDRIEAELLHTGAWEGELVHALKDGTRVTLASRWSLLRDEASAPIAILEAYSDITERKRAQAECAKLEERLQQAEKLTTIGRFACGVAHDFNNVLGAILPNADMLAREAPADTALKRRAQNIFAAAERGRHLAHQILAYCSDQSAERMPTDVCRTVADTLDLVRSSLPHGIALHSTIPYQPLVVMGDDTQLHQVVMNLCTNAIHAMKAGGALRVAITALEMDADRALTHGSLRAGRHVRVSVADCGCGMDEATLTRIFEPFFTTRGRGYGTGLGLALVQAIVTDFGGAIDVKSAPGEGSSFSIYLPITDDCTP
jgi:signal transduction histidine kinase